MSNTTSLRGANLKGKLYLSTPWPQSPGASCHKGWPPALSLSLPGRGRSYPWREETAGNCEGCSPQETVSTNCRTVWDNMYCRKEEKEVEARAWGSLTWGLGGDCWRVPLSWRCCHCQSSLWCQIWTVLPHLNKGYIHWRAPASWKRKASLLQWEKIYLNT